MIYVTGDIHARPERLNLLRHYGIDAKSLTKDDTLIILGDFGLVWNYDGESREEKYWLNWLEDKPFTTVFVDGNHENFDRLLSMNEYPLREWNGGLVHEIRPSVLHLIRGEIYTIEGKKFFAFGGASSHDIQDGILDPNDPNFMDTYRRYKKENKIFRVKGVSWWERELPSEAEMQRGIENLEKHNWEVDYVITHCLPQTIAAVLLRGICESDVLTNYFDELLLDRELKFKKWYCGHYHVDTNIYGKFRIRYEEVEEVE